ncbi:unnamed protein product [Kuraishia capsulata CBS 1993]|uniref:Nodulin-like domain-containing protein n=1 Tax=Kuraishia capsulata CBS 1993 TaxID=1382522 RepID=W6MMW6_9ASCO|nr:uncharacterized protein KUCA_T00003944001 [Kuraishia capsulata CBS 1993]CDK27964.1 unnamed protein product [Kuraishia capsulata CBS 1993]
MLGTLGVLFSGPVAGVTVDKTGYSLAIVSGSLAIGSGYYLFRKQFEEAYSSVPYTCFLLFCVGSGSTFINAACIKCCMVTFPSIRGLATSLPVAMYGISAMCYSAVGSRFYPGDTAGFLGFLSTSSLIVAALCGPMICLCDRSSHIHHRIGTDTPRASASIELTNFGSGTVTPVRQAGNPMPIAGFKNPDHDITASRPLFKQIEFWALATILSVIAGIGQMYVYSVGYVVTSLFGDSKFIAQHTATYSILVQQQQQLQVGIISLASCTGRISSGLLADIFSSTLHWSRTWLLFVPGVLIFSAQILGATVSSLQAVGVTSSLLGFGYGFLYCILPIIVGDIWGLTNFSFNWGITNVFTIIPNMVLAGYFGRVYDSHVTLKEFSLVVGGGDDGAKETIKLMVCDLGRECYNSAFKLTALLSLVALLLIGFFNLRQHAVSKRHLKQRRLSS